MPDIAIVAWTSNTITVVVDGRTFDLHAVWLGGSTPALLPDASSQR